MNEWIFEFIFVALLGSTHYRFSILQRTKLVILQNLHKLCNLEVQLKFINLFSLVEWLNFCSDKHVAMPTKSSVRDFYEKKIEIESKVTQIFKITENTTFRITLNQKPLEKHLESQE